MKYYCNPVNINYRYQFQNGEKAQIYREAADPSMIMFKGRYYIFASMTLGVWVSDDLAHWENHRLSDELPLYDYAPDVRVMGEYVYFSASRQFKNCDMYRTRDIINGPYEKIPGNFPYWDPHLFIDDDGRVYFYWGCSNMAPIYGTELDSRAMLPIGEIKELIEGHPEVRGYERVGENNSKMPATEEEIEKAFQKFMQERGKTEDEFPTEKLLSMKGMFSNRPYIEGAWMDKQKGKYYLQYAFAGTEYNTYGNGVYVGESPLGPFLPQRNNPYSYHPGGFLPGAGHGSTMEDKSGNLWHAATMRISVNHIFERRIGIWPAGFDIDGELFCNQRFGDWPRAVPKAGKESRINPWENPEWMLLSVRKEMTASSEAKGCCAPKSADENAQTWWKPISKGKEEWLQMDLGKVYTVHAVQINFADDCPDIPCPGEMQGEAKARFIDDKTYPTRWKLLGSEDGANWFIIEDKSAADTDLSHDFIVREEGFSARYLKLTDMSVPYGQIPCISGLRVFGSGDGNKPAIPQFKATRVNDLDMKVEIFPESEDTQHDRALGNNILWGYTPEKLYHSWLIFEEQVRIGALVKGEEYYVRVDAFNESGITDGKITKL